ncbi:hypothetical protein ACP4J4_01815 [Aureimonas ureilytica]|uniref:hypothetical protein n=1 Tax=Aureimonas ureilytica TaxID=401562 RepID=UPI003CFB139C
MAKALRQKTRGEKPGPDGTVHQPRSKREGDGSKQAFVVRCRPGTFEWRYGRHDNAQYQAGTKFARLWERAGIASCGGALHEASGGTDWKGLPDGRVVALDQVRQIGQEIGGPMTRRLVAYLVEGRTPKEIAATYKGQVTDRQVSDTLDLDLIELARAMGFAA